MKMEKKVRALKDCIRGSLKVFFSEVEKNKAIITNKFLAFTVVIEL